MEIESPADAWYVWVAVAVVSLTVAGVVLALPGEPPPDADEAANAVDRVATSEYGAQTRYETDADDVRIGTKRISLRNDGGTDHASVAFGSITPVTATTGATHRAGSALLAGETVEASIESSRFDSEQELREAFREARAAIDENGAKWHGADGRLGIRSVEIAGEMVVLVGLR